MFFTAYQKSQNSSSEGVKDCMKKFDYVSKKIMKDYFCNSVNVSSDPQGPAIGSWVRIQEIKKKRIKTRTLTKD